MHHQLDFGTYGHHAYHTHYLLTSTFTPALSTAKYSQDAIRALSWQDLGYFELEQKE